MNSCRTLRLYRSPLDPLHLRDQRLHHTVRRPIAQRDLSHMVGRDLTFARDPGKNTGQAGRIFESRNDSVRIHREEALRYESNPRTDFLDGQGESCVPASSGKPQRWAQRIAALRKFRGMSQTEFAQALRIDQTSVSKWERGLNRPTPDMFARLAGLADGVEKFYFLEEAGIPKEYFMGGIEKVLPSELITASQNIVASALVGYAAIDSVAVPILADAVAAGNPLTINERDISSVVPLPSVWLPRGAQLYGLSVEGDSMSPVLHDGDIVIVDVSKRDVKKLVGSMVAARVGDGVTIKYLRKSGKFHQLVPQNTSPRHEICIMSEDDDWAIVGEIVKIIATPPQPLKARK
jgi:SOS-response transcriptional repressor LexA